MKKNLLLLLLLNLLLLAACSEAKPSYTEEEIEYLENVMAVVEQSTKYYNEFTISITDYQNNKSKDTSNELLSQILAIGIVEDIFKNEMSPPDKFKDVHEELLLGIELLSKASVVLPSRIHTQDEAIIKENFDNLEQAGEHIENASKIILNSYDNLSK